MSDILEKILNWIADIIKKYLWEIVILGLINAIIGLFTGHKAKTINNEAVTIRDDAISRFERSNQLTQEILKQLGNLQIEIISSFDEFIAAMEKIHGRPQGLAAKITKASLPKYEPETLRDLSEKVKLGLAGLGGFGAGAGIGYAALGLQGIMMAPAALVAGMAICVKGCSLSKQAVKNKKQAVKLSKDVDEIVEYHTKLRCSADALYNSMSELKTIYYKHMTELKDLTSRKTEWKSFSKQEKLMVENSIRLVSLMHKMCKVQLVVKPEKEGEIERVNEKVVKTVTADAKELVGIIV